MRWRGKLVILMMMNIAGFCLVNWINYALSFVGGSVAWRFPFAFQFVFPLILWGSAPWLPGSPRQVFFSLSSVARSLVLRRSVGSWRMDGMRKREKCSVVLKRSRPTTLFSSHSVMRSITAFSSSARILSAGETSGSRKTMGPRPPEDRFWVLAPNSCNSSRGSALCFISCPRCL